MPMSSPLIDADDLGTYLGDDSIDTDRAAMLIDQATQACLAVVDPIPASKMFVLYRVTAKAYMATVARSYQMLQAGAEYYMPGVIPGVALSAQDRADLIGDEEQAGVEAFTIRLSSSQQCAPWDSWQQPSPWNCW